MGFHYSITFWQKSFHKIEMEEIGNSWNEFHLTHVVTISPAQVFLNISLVLK